MGGMSTNPSGSAAPGPWHVFSLYADHEGRTPSDTLIAVVQNREHARLIAAAPLMLEALQTAMQALRSFQYGNSSEEFAKAQADNCKAVIAAATGEQP